MIARPGHGPLRLHLWLRHLVLPMFARLCDDAVGLMPILRGQLAVPLQDFLRRQQFLAVARMVGRDLRRRGSVDSLLPEMVFDLFPARAGRLQILLRISLDFRLSMLAALQFVAQLFKTQRQLRSVDRRDVALRHEYLVRLQGAHLFPIFETVLALGHIEDHGMGVKLRRRIAIDGPRRVVLEGGGDEFACCLRRMDIADARLRVSLQFPKRRADALPVGFPHTIIAAHESGNRYRLRRGERGVPPGAMLDAGDLSAVFAFIGSRNLMPDELLFGVRMLAFAQSRKVFGTNATCKPHCSASLPCHSL